MAGRQRSAKDGVLAQNPLPPDSSHLHEWKISKDQLTRDERSFKWGRIAEVDEIYGQVLTSAQKHAISDAISRAILQNPDIRKMIAKIYAQGDRQDMALAEKLANRFGSEFDKELQKEESLRQLPEKNKK